MSVVRSALASIAARLASSTSAPTLRRDLGGQLHQPLDPLELRSKLGVEHRFLELGQAVLERQLEVGLVEELRVATGARG